ncbi:hypothetical protein [Burkholderia gladioli]|uniref:hypothetical protein n=1 Tax=Burkholderia gladioli TaxID=28095 RepID=UPI000CFE94EA|nr:hypothetical protein [Burkholderia gladioli]MBJ9663859.1 hypothetical protein [Burkholderia gladioli]PRE81818.1 hypothetical protein C6Q13_22565 [Burkholderia gladioli]
MPEQPTEPAPASSRGRPLAMLRYAAVCLLVAVIAGVRGFGIFAGVRGFGIFAGASGAGVSNAMALVERIGCIALLVVALGLFVAAVRRR